MIRPKTEEEIELLRINGELVSRTLAEVGKLVAPGVTTAKLNEVAETFIRDHGAVPSFKGFDGFPAALCMSVNDVVVHGFPSDEPLKEGIAPLSRMKVSATLFNSRVVTPGATTLPTSASVRDTRSPLMRSSSISSSVFGLTILL